MGKIIIESATAAKIYINNKQEGTVNKQIKAYELEDGQYEVYAKANWCGSQKVNVNLTNNQEVTLTLNSFKYEAVIKAIFMLLSGLLIFTKNLIFAVLAGLVFLYPLYYITIGKDNYLELVEKNN